jgi:hypothetical protein
MTGTRTRIGTPATAHTRAGQVGLERIAACDDLADRQAPGPRAAHRRRRPVVSTPPAEPTLADVQHEYPAWRCWRGISGLYHAACTGQERDGQPEVTGEGPLDLRDQIRRAQAPSTWHATRAGYGGSTGTPASHSQDT